MDIIAVTWILIIVVILGILIYYLIKLSGDKKYSKK